MLVNHNAINMGCGVVVLECKVEVVCRLNSFGCVVGGICSV